jgi:hypothetical protein
VLVEMLRDAVDELAIVYEDVAYASVGESKQEQVRATWHARAARRASILARCAASRCLPDEEEPQP